MLSNEVLTAYQDRLCQNRPIGKLFEYVLSRAIRDDYDDTELLTKTELILTRLEQESDGTPLEQLVIEILNSPIERE